MIFFQKKFFSDQQGFTALELVIVAGIMAFLLVLVLSNFRGFEQRSALDGETDKLASVLRQAQIWSLTGQTSSATRYSYGVHLSKCASGSCAYILFRDTETGGNKLYDAGEEVVSYTLPQGVYVDSLTPNISNQSDIVFLAPLGLVYINGAVSASEEAIVLKHTTGRQKSVTVNRVSGQINVQ